MANTAIDRIGTDPAFQELFRSGHRRRYRKNQGVLAEGEISDNIYFILSGTVAVRLSNWHGREVLLAYMHAGDFFGEMCLFPGTRTRSAMIRTVTECMVLELPYRRFLELAGRQPGLWLELAGQLAARLRATNRRLAELPMVPAVERVWSLILELAERSGEPVPGPGPFPGVSIRIRREDLGRLAGCSREVAGSALQELAAAGRLRLSGHRIVVPIARKGAR